MKQMTKQEQDRWVAEHADQFENDCRPLGRETGIKAPDHVRKAIEEARSKKRSPDSGEQ